MKFTVKISIFVLVILMLIVPALSFQANLSYKNGTQVDQIFYDRAGQIVGSNTYGSDSYMDHSYTTPNIFINVCHPNLTIGQQIDLVYSSINDSLLFSALHYRPQVHSLFEKTINGTLMNCTTMDVSLAATKTLFPGYLTPILIPKNSTYNWTNYNSSEVEKLETLPTFLNGSFKVGINVAGPPKKYLITPSKAYDQSGQEITKNSRELLLSLVDANNISRKEKRLALGESMAYTQDIVGGEKVYINDILSLKIKLYNPCDSINGSGYYVMNGSVYNQNTTCINIDNSTNLVINFADEIITGDGNLSGSKSNNTCAVTIKNSDHVTIENLKTANYYYGVCVENSSVTVFGTGSTANIRGAKVDKNSVVNFVDLLLTNEESEIVSQNDSIVNFYSVNVTTAMLDSTFKNVIVKEVKTLPEPLDKPGLVNISQFVEYIRNANNSYAQMSFHYTDPLPNEGAIDNVTIYEYSRGKTIYTTETLINQTDNSTYNITRKNITSGNWSPVFTLVSPSQKLIIGPNKTSFSIFAPYTNKAQPVPKPKPTPTPTPTPVPQSGESSGSGGTPTAPQFTEVGEAVEKPLVLNLSVPKNLTFMQGEVGQINFTIKNNGDGDSGKLVISPQTRRGWDFSNQTVESLSPEDSYAGNVMIAPYEKELPGNYLVPVTIHIYDKNKNLVKLLSEVVQIKVTPRASLKRLKILEYPPEIIYRPHSELDVSLLVKNIGDFDLKNVKPVLEDSPCVKKIIGSSSTLKKGDLSDLKYTFVFASGDSCYTNIKFYSNDELIGFLPLHLEGDKKTPSLEFPKARTYKIVIWMIIFIGWSLLTILVIERKVRRQ